MMWCGSRDRFLRNATRESQRRRRSKGGAAITTDQKAAQRADLSPLAHSQLTPPERQLFDMMTGFFSTRLLGIALARDLFTHLSRAPQSLGRIQTYLGFPERSCTVFLEGLVAIGLVVNQGDSYANGAIAETYLVKGRPEFQGANVRLFESLYEACAELETTLMTGTPATKDFAYFFGEGDAPANGYADLMHESGVVPTLLLMEYYDFSQCTWLLDVGGGSGRLAATLVSQHSHLNVILYDLPQICVTAKDFLTPFPAMSNRVEVYPGDFFRDDLPEGADTAVFMRILHDWPDDTARLLLRKAYKALPPGGRILIYETMRASDQTPDETFAVSLLMLMISPAGRIRSYNEVRSLLAEARFTDIEVTPTDYLYTLITAQKPDHPL